MADARFFHRAGPFALADIAAVVGAEPLLPDDAPVPIKDIATLESAGPDDISVFSDVRYLQALAPSRAGAIIVSRRLAHHAPASSRLLYVADPRRAYAQVGRLFYPQPTLTPGVHPSAHVHPSACIGPGTQIDAGAVIPPHAHPHEQAGLVLDGQLELIIDGVSRTLSPARPTSFPAT